MENFNAILCNTTTFVNDEIHLPREATIVGDKVEDKFVTMVMENDDWTMDEEDEKLLSDVLFSFQCSVDDKEESDADDTYQNTSYSQIQQQVNSEPANLREESFLPSASNHEVNDEPGEVREELFRSSTHGVGSRNP